MPEIRGYVNGTAVASAGHPPEQHLRGLRNDQPCMTVWNVIVSRAMDQQHWNGRCGDCGRRRNLLKVEAVFLSSPPESSYDRWTKKSSSEPRPGMKELAYAVVANLP